MLKRKNVSSKLEPAFAEVESAVTDRYYSGKTVSEDWISASLVSELERVDRSYKSGKYDVEVGVEAFEAHDEPESGADIGIRYQFHGPSFRISRGIIVQAKRYGTSHPDLPLQCFKMTQRTEQAYVFTYSESEISVFPALPILLDEGTGGKFTKYYSNPFPQFMSDFVEGFYGEIPVAENIDEPSNIHPVEERVRYIVDIKTGVSVRDEFVDFEFDRVDRSHYSRIDPGEYQSDES